MIKLGEDVETELRTQVIQAREVKPGVFGMYEPNIDLVFGLGLEIIKINMPGYTLLS